MYASFGACLLPELSRRLKLKIWLVVSGRQVKTGAETDVHVLARTVADGEATARLVAGRGGPGRALGKDALRSALREMLPTR